MTSGPNTTCEGVNERLDPGYRTKPPTSGEDIRAYCRRLEGLGHEEMFLRTAVACHFPGHVHLSEMADFFREYEQARAGHLALLRTIFRDRPESWFIRKLSKNLGVPMDEAREWVESPL
ncbi:hypothetical protein FHY55_03670 [Oceanicola sp. D3]|uniref:hypothetical protein n=1 Tax=Oceanicola sp. D3 TaxID=2587163 RepID=UPI00111CDAC9|nr:hypothetical protein [Oceanicola sp. D3]QDC08396.1 hypothetical protein FHY55_03670 [Oceanicola sp. D3]